MLSHEQYEGKSTVAFYAVGGPSGDDTAEKELAFARQMKLNMPLAFDSRTPFAVRVVPAGKERTT